MKKPLAIFLSVCSLFVWLVNHQWPDRFVHLIFCDVGQGDATLITDGFIQLLVDGGPDDRVLQCLQTHMPFWDRTIEFVVATHPDADHINGLVPVLKNYQVKTILSTSLTKKTADFESFSAALEIAERNQAKIIRPTIGQVITLSDSISATILHPRESLKADGTVEMQPPETLLSDKKSNKNAELLAKNDYNNWSIVLFCMLDDVRVLLTGDLEKEGEEALVEAGLTPRVDILKVGHHGSKTSSTPSFLDKLQPEWGIISVGRNNRYSHPAPEVLTSLESRHVTVLRTDALGTVEFAVDGGTYWQPQR